ncbi:MAG: polysaccharide biosynthesis tyrosine autokinase [Actinomycetota bacterium]
MPSDLETPAMDLRDYVRVVRRRKLIILLGIVVGVGGALGLAYRETPIYQAGTKILVAPRLSEQILATEQASGTAVGPGLATEIELLNSPKTRQAAAKDLGHVPSVTVQVVGTTQVVALIASSTSPEAAAGDANGYAKTYIELRRQTLYDELLAASTEIQKRVGKLDEERAAVESELNALGAPLGEDPDPAREADRRRLDERLVTIETQRDVYLQQLTDLEISANIAEQGGGAEVIAEATPPSSPVSPKPIRNAIAGLGIGLVFGVGLALLREYLDDTIRNEDGVARATGGLTVVGRIPAVQGWKNRKAPMLVSASNPNSAAAEAYRMLRTNVEFLDLDQPIHTLQVTSAIAVEGKTTTLANLAVTMAKTGRRVIVACCDLRRPRVHEFFGVSHDVGFTSLLLGEVPMSEALQQTSVGTGLLVLASGPPPPNPSELLSSRRAAELFELLSARCDLLLIDSPPVLPVTDALVISGLVDATLVVATAGTTTKRGLHRAVSALRQVDAPLVGTVLNGIGTADAYGYGYGGYGYGYTEPIRGGRARGEREEGANGRKRFRKKAESSSRRS